MIKYENDCVGCPPEMGCLGDACPNRHVPYYYCDKCGDNVNELWTVDGNEFWTVDGYEVCEECLKTLFPKVIA